MTTFAHGLAGETERILQPGSGTPLAYCIDPPKLPRPLFVLGGHDRSSGGCDTISQADRCLDAIVALADARARHGHAVLLEEGERRARALHGVRPTP